MSLSIGIVGLPNVGKSTLFNALVKNAQAEARNFPFTTIEPNVGIVTIPDERLDRLAEIEHSAKTIPTSIKFVDIAGLIRGAHKGEGLGNQFLSHIREVDAICLVLRDFRSGDTIHVEGSIDPKRDAETILAELALADLQMISAKKSRLSGEVKKAGKEGEAARELQDVIQKIEPVLNEGKLAQTVELTKDERKIVKRELQLLTDKPILAVLNVDEGKAGEHPDDIARETDLASALPHNTKVIPICAKAEAELVDMSPEEQNDYLEMMGLKESGLRRLAREAYTILKLITFFTAGEMEARAWTVREGAAAPEAAGVIHTDFQKNFIRAEVVTYDDFVGHNGWSGSGAAGKMRLEGKDYIVHDGDVMFFRHT